MNDKKLAARIRLQKKQNLERPRPTLKKVEFKSIDDDLLLRENHRHNSEAKEVVTSLVKGSLGLIGLGVMFLTSAKALNYLDRKVFHVGAFYNKEDKKDKDNEKDKKDDK